MSNLEKKIEKLTESFALKLAKLHLTEEFDDIDIEDEDIESIVNLSVSSIEEIVRSLLSSCACGYFGNMIEAEEEEVELTKVLNTSKLGKSKFSLVRA